MLTPVEHAPLAPHCTLGVGGPARYFVEATRRGNRAEAVRVGRARAALPLRVLGGGSNLVVADEGVDGLVVQIAPARRRPRARSPARVELTAAAGEPWDGVVRHTVERGWAGLECLSGIPGLVGATPIQNVGAYGQEVSDTHHGGARARHARAATSSRSRRADCGFAYRDSMLQEPRAGPLGRARRDLPARPGRRAHLGYADVAREHLAARGVRAHAGRRARDRARHPPLQVDGARPRRSQPRGAAARSS